MRSFKNLRQSGNGVKTQDFKEKVPLYILSELKTDTETIYKGWGIKGSEKNQEKHNGHNKTLVMQKEKNDKTPGKINR